MERIFDHRPPELPKKGETLLTTQQPVITEKGAKVFVSKDLVVGNPNDLRLSSSETHKIQYDSHRHGIGKGLEKSMIFHTQTDQTVLIFDTDHLNYPYLSYLIAKGFIREPLNFIHVDAHIDLGSLQQEPKAKPFLSLDLDESLSYFRDYVSDYNFVTALAASNYIKSISYLSPTSMRDLFSDTNYWCVINAYHIALNHLFPSEYGKYFSLFEDRIKNILAIDLDFFGYPFNRYQPDTLSPSLRAQRLCDNLIDAGYNAKSVPVICLATSPGYNDGYKTEEEKLEVIEVIIKRLNLQPPNEAIEL